MNNSRGYSLLEVSLCLVIGAIIFTSFISFYQSHLVDMAYRTSAMQISDEILMVKKYLIKNGDNGLSWDTYCVASLGDDFMKRILQNTASNTPINQHISVYIKKKECQSRPTDKQAYSILFALSGGREMNSVNAGRFATMIGNSGGIYSRNTHSFNGWKNRWRVHIGDWGIKENDYMVGAYDYFVRTINTVDNKAVIYNIKLLPLPDSIADESTPMKVHSLDDKIEIKWRGANLKYIKLLLSLKNQSKVVEITLPSQNYGGDYFFVPYRFFPAVTGGEYDLHVQAIAYETNNNVVSSAEGNLAIKFNS